MRLCTNVCPRVRVRVHIRTSYFSMCLIFARPSAFPPPPPPPPSLVFFQQRVNDTTPYSWTPKKTFRSHSFLFHGAKDGWLALRQPHRLTWRKTPTTVQPQEASLYPQQQQEESVDQHGDGQQQAVGRLVHSVRWHCPPHWLPLPHPASHFTLLPRFLPCQWALGVLWTSL